MTERFNRISVEDTRNIFGGKTYTCIRCGYKITSGFWYKAPAHVFSKHYIKDAGNAIYDFFR